MHFRANALMALMISVCLFGAGLASDFAFYASPGFQIGSTYWDAQHNARMARQIVAGGGWVHNAWTYLPGPSTANRDIQYYAWQINGAGTVFNADVDSSTGAGYTSIDYDPANGGAAVLGYHNVSANGTRFSRDSGVAAGSFSPRFTFPAANCQGIVTVGGTEGPYIWPVIATDIDGSGNGIVHAISTESPGSVATKSSMVYYRSNSGMSGIGATCGQFIDSVLNIGATVVSDPSSDKVAIVYIFPVGDGFVNQSQRDQDVVYRESGDLGNTWGPAINITQYTSAIKERAYSDVNAMYTTDGCLHITWVAAHFDSAAGIFASEACKLRHWDDCGQCQTLVRDASYEEVGCDRGIWQSNIARMNLSECTVGGSNRLYITYTQFLGSDTGVPGPSDCSQAGYSNGELFLQASSTSGRTWGPAINLTNTPTPGCITGECASENWSSSAMYVTDSLRIQYLLDLDAGRAGGFEGTWTDNPVMNMAVPCVEMAAYASLSLTPTEFLYPFHTDPLQDTTVTFLIQNSGSATANYARSIEYLNGSGWLDFPSQPASGSVSAGCVNSITATMVATGPAAQGLFKARVHFVYDSGFGVDTATLAVDLYNFETLCDPPQAVIRTSCARLHVDQTARVGDQDSFNGFTYFADGSSFLYDGSLILGTSASNMSWSIYKPDPNSCGVPPAAPGLLYGLGQLSFDSTSSASYRRVSGKGTNRDSTVGYSVDYYAPKHPDSCDFFVAHFRLYKGANNPTGTVTNLTVGFACDWDVPTNTGSDNYGGFDDTRQMVFQRGTNFDLSGTSYGAMAAYRQDADPIVGGFVWDSETHVYPNIDYVPSELWNEMELLSEGEYTSSSQLEDLNSVLTIYRNAVINGAVDDTLKFVVILAAAREVSSASAITLRVDKGINFAIDHGLIPDLLACLHGDADNNGIITISDAVYMINYIFAGGPPPATPCLGDADCNCILTISDAVYLINYIFAGGPFPVCPFYFCK